MLAIDPDLVELSRVGRAASDRGRFAQNPDAGTATAAHGRHILDLALERIGEVVASFTLAARDSALIPMEAMAPIWAEIEAGRSTWRTLNL